MSAVERPDGMLAWTTEPPTEPGAFYAVPTPKAFGMKWWNGWLDEPRPLPVAVFDPGDSRGVLRVAAAACDCWLDLDDFARWCRLPDPPPTEAPHG